MTGFRKINANIPAFIKMDKIGKHFSSCIWTNLKSDCHDFSLKVNFNQGNHFLLMEYFKTRFYKVEIKHAYCTTTNVFSR